MTTLKGKHDEQRWLTGLSGRQRTTFTLSRIQTSSLRYPMMDDGRHTQQNKTKKLNTNINIYLRLTFFRVKSVGFSVSSISLCPRSWVVWTVDRNPSKTPLNVNFFILVLATFQSSFSFFGSMVTTFYYAQFTTTKNELFLIAWDRGSSTTVWFSSLVVFRQRFFFLLFTGPLHTRIPTEKVRRILFSVLLVCLCLLFFFQDVSLL